MADDYTSYAGNGGSADERGGFVALAVIAAAVGAGAALLLAPETGAKTRKRVGQGFQSFRGEAAETIGQLQREIRRKRHQSRRENRLMGLAGLLIGAGLAAVLTPESGPATRQRLGSTWSRIKVGAVDRIGRLRAQPESGEPGVQPDSVRTVQELGRDPNAVF
ncbi:MAG TPA: YtxH domain-containing protein [Gemmatimonadales bacterium]|nr:YtxH domain-containing protein [Gemmatimonadales bacterium]